MIGAWEESLNQVLMRYGVTKETLQGNAAEELESALQEYHDLAQQYGDMLTVFCYEAKPLLRSGIWLCPKCEKRIQYGHTHCHWCGKKIGWAGTRRM
ncbi:hypothetical protein D7X48_14820 [bacterium D16-50]|nr:hypothetical protein D7X48_14820 [bacterium D16-50]